MAFCFGGWESLSGVCAISIWALRAERWNSAVPDAGQAKRGIAGPVTTVVRVGEPDSVANARIWF